MRKILALFLVLGIILTLSGCEGGGTTVTDRKNPIVTVTMADGAIMRIELYPDVAPNTVANFVSLIQNKYYDDLTFHRVIAGFVIQGGDPTGTGSGGPGYTVKGEFASNGFSQNTLKHTRGVISMARSSDPNSAGSQFFVVHQAAPSLDGGYAAFGKLMDEESLYTLDSIALTQTDSRDRPLAEQKMRTVTVDTFGTEYKPVTIK